MKDLLEACHILFINLTLAFISFVALRICAWKCRPKPQSCTMPGAISQCFAIVIAGEHNYSICWGTCPALLPYFAQSNSPISLLFLLRVYMLLYLDCVHARLRTVLLIHDHEQYCSLCNEIIAKIFYLDDRWIASISSVHNRSDFIFHHYTT